jgi:hypothetical protein
MPFFLVPMILRPKNFFSPGHGVPLFQQLHDSIMLPFSRVLKHTPIGISSFFDLGMRSLPRSLCHLDLPLENLSGTTTPNNCVFYDNNDTYLITLVFPIKKF